MWTEQTRHSPHRRKCTVFWSARSHFFNALEGKQNFMNKIKITSLNGDNSAESYQPYLRFQQIEIRAYQNVKVIAKWKRTVPPAKTSVLLIQNIPGSVLLTYWFFRYFFFQGCLITSCLNGGSCFHDNENNTFSCSCKQPWTGDRCEVKKGNSEFFFLYHIKLVTQSTFHKQFPFYIKRSEFSVVLLKKKPFCTMEEVASPWG